MISAAPGVPPNIAELARSIEATSLRMLFANDPDRAVQLSRRLHLDDCDLLVDFSRQRLTAEVIAALTDLARERGVEHERDRMIRGEVVNATEGRAVTHMATRATNDVTAPQSLRDESAVHAAAMQRLVDETPSGVTHVVNIGIGGSDLGPAMLCDALSSMYVPHRDFRFVSNVDPLDFDRGVAGLEPGRTVFVVCSKSFGTIETLANARRAADWLAAAGIEPTKHMIAVTARPERVPTTGLSITRVLTMPESVGGRYSLSSSVMLTVALSFGVQVVEAVRDGMRLVDEHFARTPLHENIPALLGLVWWWNTEVLGCRAVAVVPYTTALSHLPQYLSQLVMESNGKSVDVSGNPVSMSSPVVFGATGTNAQHAFFQLLHQGPQPVPCDFVGCSRALGSSQDDHDVLVANMFAQAQALAFGVAADELQGDDAPAHRVMPGNRPSTTLLFSRLTPRSLGALVALYEHATFVQGVMWGINSFDQWGVELGKKIAAQLVQDMNGTAAGTTTDTGSSSGSSSDKASFSAHDQATHLLFTQHLRWRNEP